MFSIVTITIINCNKELNSTQTESLAPVFPEKDYDYNSSNTAISNPINNKLAKLGRVLFYDKKLSFNNKVSCASCHKQQDGFADNLAKSDGYLGTKTLRNSIGIINLSKFNSLFWDGRENQLDSMVLKPILNHIEMGVNNLDEIESKIAAYDYYKNLFKDVYGDEEISDMKIGQALAEFTRSIRTSEQFNNNLPGLLQSNGGRLFTKYRCNNCHSIGDINTSWGAEFANTGLDMVSEDKGAGGLKNLEFLEGSFKIPSLINVGLTAPYMHDGRFSKLEDVLNHYSSGIKPAKNLDFRLQEGMDSFVFTSKDPLLVQQENKKREIKPRNSNITESDKKELINFLKSLDDKVLISDIKFSNPFYVKKN